jgi:hypothetical protein
MRYVNRSLQHINESEKRQILSLYKKMDLQNIFETKKYKTDIQELISDFSKSLNTQRRYLSSLFINLPVNESIVILNNIKEDSVKNLFGQNKVVLENYNTFYNNLLTEESLSPIDELDRFHKFLSESISIELDRINEQFMDYIQSAASQVGDALYQGAQVVGNTVKQGATAVYDAGKKAVDTATQWLNYATDYIVKVGVGPFMESLRSALFSVAGTAIQILVSLTGPATAGIGPAIVTGIWCILGLYDLYQITQGKDGAWANFIIDVICALTAGSMGSVLGKFAGTVGKTLTAALENLVLKGMGPYIIPVIYALQKSIGATSRWFTWAGNFAKANLGIGWLANKVAPAIKYMSEVVETLFQKLGLNPREGLKTPLGQAGYLAGKTVASLIPSATLRTTGALAARMNPAVWGKLANLSSQEVGLIAGQTLEQGTMKAIEKEMNARFKEQPTEKALQWVDQMYGTAYGDAYLAYLGGRKMFKYQDGKFISRVENTANTMRGQYDYAQTQAGRIQQGVGAVVGDNPTSAQTSKVQGVAGKNVSNQGVKNMKAKVGT